MSGSIGPFVAQRGGTDNAPIDFASPKPAPSAAPLDRCWFGEENINVAVFSNTAALLRQFR